MVPACEVAGDFHQQIYVKFILLRKGPGMTPPTVPPQPRRGCSDPEDIQTNTP